MSKEFYDDVEWEEREYINDKDIKEELKNGRTKN